MIDYTAIPKWLRDAVTDGVQHLFDLRLPGSPAQDRIHHTAMSLASTIYRWPIAWNAESDLQRLHAMFTAAAGDCYRWPSPAELRQHLPSRPKPPALAAPASKVDMAAVEAEVARIFGDSQRGGS